MWVGNGKITTRTPRRHRLGDYVVPERFEFTFTGENGDPDLHAVLAIRDGRPSLIELRFSAKESGRPIFSPDVRAVDPETLVANLFQSQARRIEDPATGMYTVGGPVSDQDWWAANKVVTEAVKAPGRGVSELELRRVAEIYQEHESSGAPRVAVQAIMNYRSKATAFRRIKKARDEGYFDQAAPVDPVEPVSEQDLRAMLRRNAGRED